jgi:hypothetical protein
MYRYINESENIIESTAKEVLGGLIKYTGTVARLYARSKIGKLFNRSKSVKGV